MPSQSIEPSQPAPGDDLCQVCGTPRPRHALGAQCPRCLLSLASSFGDIGASTADDLLDAGQVRNFGDFELLEEIARGGMGIVYRARQISLQRDVAIKMILAGELAGRAALRRFQVEAHAAARLHHPHIIPVHEIGEHETQHFFTMRYVAGGRTIADWAKLHRGDYRAISSVAAQVARAVAHAHSHGVLHLDLKPSNVLWDLELGPQVTDFGLAQLLEGNDSTTTRTLQALGSPSYMAPEQMNGRTAEITTVTDVYGLGAVLYEMLAGRPPFAGASAIETMRRAAEEDPAPLPNVPKDLRTICLQCLAKDQADRYASAAALADDLERFAHGEPVSVVSLTTPQLLWRWGRRHPRTAALVALCAASIVAGLGGALWQWRQAEKARAEQARALDDLRWQEIGHWLDDGDAGRALAYLAAILRERPARWPAAMYAMSIVERFSFPVLAGPKIYPTAPLIGWARLTPDGKSVIGAGQDRAVHVWDVLSGKEVAMLPQAAPIKALAVGRGSAVLALATQDGALVLYPSLTATPVQLNRATRDAIEELSFSANGTQLLARGKKQLEVWSADAPGEAARTIPFADSTGALIAADGRHVLAWSPKQAIVWEVTSGRELLRATAEQMFRFGSLAANGERAALLDGQFKARVWEVSSGRFLSGIESPLTPVSRIVFDEEGKRLTLAGNSNHLTVFDLESGLQVSPPMNHHYNIVELIASPDGRVMASYGDDDVIKTWDAHTGRARLIAIPLNGHFREHVGMDLSTDGSALLGHIRAQEGAPETISTWRATRVREPERRSMEGQRNFDPVRLSPDGRLGCVGFCPGNRCYLYEFATGRVVLDKTVEGPAYVHLFSADMRRYYVLTANGWLHGWSLESGEELWPPNHQPGLVRPAELSPDGTRIAVGHNDGHIRIYDTSSGQVVQTLDHPGEIKVLRFAPDGSGRFVSGSTDRLAHVWDLSTGKLLQTFAGHTDTIISAAWSPDGRRLATASYDRTVRVWEVGTGRPVGEVMPHGGFLSHVEFSPDGQALAAACRDGTVQLWDPETGRARTRPLLQEAACETVRFTRDGATICVRNHDSFQFWDTATGEPVTVRYPEPGVSGLGMDSESYRAIMTGDGRHVFLGHSMNHAALWTIPQPRQPVPPWFPDFLEMLARVRSGGRDSGRTSEQMGAELRRTLEAAPSGDEYAAWAWGILGTAQR